MKRCSFNREKRACKAIYHGHSPVRYHFHFWHIIKGNRFITDKFGIYFHPRTTGKRLVLTFVIFFPRRKQRPNFRLRLLGMGWGWILHWVFVCLSFLCYFSACSVATRGHMLWHTCQRTACGSGFLLTRAASSGQNPDRWLWWRMPFLSHLSCQPMFSRTVPRDNEL